MTFAEDMNNLAKGNRGALIKTSVDSCVMVALGTVQQEAKRGLFQCTFTIPDDVPSHLQEAVAEELCSRLCGGTYGMTGSAQGREVLLSWGDHILEAP